MPHGTNILWQGESLFVGNYLVSSSGNCYAVLQDDGNFVIYAGTNPAKFKPEFAIWSSKTNGKGYGPHTLTMQLDGNLVLYDMEKRAIWATGTNRPVPHVENHVILDDYGNLRMYSSNQLWKSH